MSATTGEDTNANIRTAAWRSILADPEVARWHAKLGLRKTGTSDERARILYRYCKALKTTPAKIASRAKEPDGGRRAAQDRLQDFVTLLHGPHKPSDHGEDDRAEKARKCCGRGHSPGYVENFSKAVKSWLEHNDVVLGRIYLGDTGATYVQDEQVLLPEQVRAAINAASPRGRVVISAVAFAGVRPEVLASRRAEDGLRIKDLPDIELDIKARSVKLLRAPAIVIVRRELSKVRRRYLTFLPGEAAHSVEEYLEHRLARGEDLKPDSPLIRADYDFERRGRPKDMRGSPFLSTPAITSEIREAMRAVGLSQRPYALRSYFISRLESASRDGKITAHDKEFFEGRKKSIDLVYAYHKGLTREDVEQMRAVYLGCEPYLGAKPTAVGPEVRVGLSGRGLEAAQVPQILLRIDEAVRQATESGQTMAIQITVAPRLPPQPGK